MVVAQLKNSFFASSIRTNKSTIFKYLANYRLLEIFKRSDKEAVFYRKPLLKIAIIPY